MGGSWESLLKPVKWALHAISTDRIFTDETLQTYLCEVKSILNKHPLTPISDDIHDFWSNYTKPSPDRLLKRQKFISKSLCYTSHYIKGLQNHCQSVQSCAIMFWNCWRNYYLPTLTSRTKWTKSKINLSKNGLVIIKSKDVPGSHWPLGGILDIYPGRDGVDCSVKIKNTQWGVDTSKSFGLCFREILWLIRYCEIKPFFTSKGDDVMTSIAFFVCENQVDDLSLSFNCWVTHIRVFYYY